MTNKGRNVDRLTPVEANVWKLHLEGKKPKEIGVLLGMKSVSVSRRLLEVKAKVAASAY